MKIKLEVPNAVLRRLPRYYCEINEMSNNGVVRTSSEILATRMGLAASQVRQDLSYFGEFGLKGYGYNIYELKRGLGRIIGVYRPSILIVVGVGHLGHALLQNFNFYQEGFLIDAAFDVSAEIVGTKVNEIDVLSLDALDDYCRENHPTVAVLTVPRSVAQETADRLVAQGVRGLWNFTGVALRLPDSVFVENVRFSDSLLMLRYRITKHDEDLRRQQLRMQEQRRKESLK